MADKLQGDFRKFMDKSFLGAWDVPDDGDLVLTIDHVARDDVKNDRGTEKKMTLHFVEREYKPMICNVTNGKNISQALGSTKVEEWERKKIAIYKAQISAFGQSTECLRVRNYAPKTDEFICELCGDVVSDQGNTKAKVIANRALTRFGKVLCYECGVKMAQELEKE